MELAENFNPEELVCGGCSDIAKAQVNLLKIKSKDFKINFKILIRCARNMAWIFWNTNAVIAALWLFSFASARLTFAILAMMTSSV